RTRLVRQQPIPDSREPWLPMRIALASACMILLLGQASVASHAQASQAEPPPAATSTTAPANASPAQDASTTAKTVLADHQLPKLVLRWDCGDCTHNEKVPPLLEQGYAA